MIAGQYSPPVRCQTARQFGGCLAEMAGQLVWVPCVNQNLLQLIQNELQCDKSDALEGSQPWASSFPLLVKKQKSIYARACQATDYVHLYVL
jgi:hypothetical protein